MEIQTLHPHVIQQCNELFFRQSMIKDILTCPQMALYSWVLNIEESEPWMAAILGTAGHEVIRHMHENSEFDLGYLELLELFNEYFDEEVEKLSKLPKLAAGCESLEEERDSKSNKYIELLEGYQVNEKNRDFRSTINEQRFALVIDNPADADHPFIFTGQIDQAGFYDDGTFALRDIKFRDNAFRPSRVEFDIDIQMTIYACALRFGNPACEKCKPRYEEDAFGLNKKLVYDGPCEECRKKGGTHRWPRKFAERCELIWMRDFETYKKDQYQKVIVDKNLPKVKSEHSNRKVYQKVTNPKWVDGYKKGDMKGPGFIRTYRTPTQINVMMSDVLRICNKIRSGEFWRNPGNHCNFWCKFQEHCRKGLELQVEEADVSAAADFFTEDPF